MPALNNDRSSKVYRLNRKTFLTFMIILSRDVEGLSSIQKQVLDIKGVTLTILKYLGLIYKDRDNKIWKVSLFGYRFVSGAVPCATHIEVFNQETSNETRKMYFQELFDKYMVENK